MSKEQDIFQQKSSSSKHTESMGLVMKARQEQEQDQF